MATPRDLKKQQLKKEVQSLMKHGSFTFSAAAIHTFVEGYDAGDPWGSIMGAWFDVADALAANGSRIPSSWEFSQGLGRPTLEDLADNANEYARMLLDNEIHEDDLIDLGDALSDLADTAKEAGLDY